MVEIDLGGEAVIIIHFETHPSFFILIENLSNENWKRAEGKPTFLYFGLCRP